MKPWSLADIADEVRGVVRGTAAWVLAPMFEALYPVETIRRSGDVLDPDDYDPIYSDGPERLAEAEEQQEVWPAFDEDRCVGPLCPHKSSAVVSAHGPAVGGEGAATIPPSPHLDAPADHHQGLPSGGVVGGVPHDVPTPPRSEDVETVSITMHRSELIPGGNGALIAYSDDFPDKQFLIIPKK